MCFLCASIKKFSFVNFFKNSPIVRKCIIFAFNGRLSRSAPMVITDDDTYMLMYPNIIIHVFVII